MKKEHSVFIDLSFDEAIELLHPIFQRKGWLKDILRDADRRPFENDGTISIEYHWEDAISTPEVE